MNVRPGDIARLVKDGEFNQNKLVEVSGPSKFGPGWWYCLALSEIRGYRQFNLLGLRFEIRNVRVKRGDHVNVCDYNLRPIRDQEGEDEMVRIMRLKKPEETTPQE